MRAAIGALLLLGASSAGRAAECEDRFTKTGNPFSGTDFASRITVPDLSVAAALAQLRAIMIAEKMDVITEDPEGGTLLVEQRSSGASRPIPTLIGISPSGTAAVIDLTIKIDSGVLAKAGAMRAYVCDLLGKVKGGNEGRAAATAGAQATASADVTTKDVFVFSREIAREAKGNALAVTARYKGRLFALKGRVDYIQEDGSQYNVSFDIPDQSAVILRVPGDREPRIGVACLFRPNQLANVLTFRKGESATFHRRFPAI